MKKFERKGSSVYDYLIFIGVLFCCCMLVFINKDTLKIRISAKEIQQQLIYQSAQINFLRADVQELKEQKQGGKETKHVQLPAVAIPGDVNKDGFIDKKEQEALDKLEKAKK